MSSAPRVALLVEPEAYGELAESVEGMLLAASTPIFRRGNRLVVPAERSVPGCDGCETVTAIFEEVSVEYLRQLMDEATAFEKFDGRNKRRKLVQPPEDIARLILKRVPDWPFPEAVGIITCPTIAPDGRLIHLPGFDAASGLYLTSYTALPRLPRKPSKDDAAQALADLNELLNEFCFVDDVGRAVALSGMISLVCRGCIPLVPMHAASAPTPGTGKSYLWDIASCVASGRHCSVIAAARSAEETEKRIAAVMLSGQPCINLDNLDAPLSSSLLCQALERPRVQVRLLGASQTPEVESRTMWFATGTNLRIVDDLTRRTIVAYLDSGLERPELREFEENPLRRIVEDRGKYILACLTIVTAYAVAGMPGTLPPLASYGEWSDRIRSALVWLDAGDPCDSMPGVRENDPSFEARAAIYAAWPGTGEYTCADLVNMAGDHAELRQALALVADGPKGLDARRLGMWLASNVGRLCNGQKVMKGKVSRGIRYWRLESLGGGTR